MDDSVSKRVADDQRLQLLLERSAPSTSEGVAAVTPFVVLGQPLAQILNELAADRAKDTAERRLQDTRLAALEVTYEHMKAQLEQQESLAALGRAAPQLSVERILSREPGTVGPSCINYYNEPELIASPTMTKSARSEEDEENLAGESIAHSHPKSSSRCALVRHSHHTFVGSIQS